MGNYEPVDWTRLKPRFAHLVACNFLPPVQPLQVELLIEVNENYLHASTIDYTGPPGTPSARLGPLGWTAVGPTSITNTQEIRLHHINVVTNEDVVKTFEQMWEIEPVKSDRGRKII